MLISRRSGVSQPSSPTGAARNPVLHDQAGDAFTRSLTGGSLRVLETLVYLDPPEHTAVRAIASEWFRPVNLTKWEGAVRDLARAAIAKHLRPGHNDIDFVRQFATHYPLHVIMSLFGVPEADEPLMMTLTQDLFGTNDPNAQRADVEPLSPTAAAEQWSASIQDFYAYFDDLEALRWVSPIKHFMRRAAKDYVLCDLQT